MRLAELWLDVQPPLSRRAVDCVVAAGASLTEKKLHDEYASLATPTGSSLATKVSICAAARLSATPRSASEAEDSEAVGAA